MLKILIVTSHLSKYQVSRDYRKTMHIFSFNGNRYRSNVAFRQVGWTPVACMSNNDIFIVRYFTFGSLIMDVGYLAVSSSSFSLGSSRESIIPRFIFAGSSAQLDRPMNATREMKLSSASSMTSSSLLSLSSKRGCRVLRGIFGESSASPTSSSTTTEANLSDVVSAFLPF